MLITIIRGRSFDGNTKNWKSCYIDQYQAIAIEITEIIMNKSISCIYCHIYNILNVQCLNMYADRKLMNLFNVQSHTTIITSLILNYSTKIHLHNCMLIV